MLLMDQQSDLDNFRANLAREYGKNPPRMLIYIGAPAFTMRDFAEKEWEKASRRSSAPRRISSAPTNTTSASRPSRTPSAFRSGS